MRLSNFPLPVNKSSQFLNSELEIIMNNLYRIKCFLSRENIYTMSEMFIYLSFGQIYRFSFMNMFCQVQK